MGKYLKTAIIVLTLSLNVLAQTVRDPRCVGLSGAYGSISRGIFAVDYNPANLAIATKYKSHRLLGGINFKVSNNLLSFRNYNKYNGANWEADNGKLKDEFLDEISRDGWRIFTDFHLPLPLLNYSWANKAITSDIIFIGDIGLPKGLLYMFFEGNPIGKELDLELKEEFFMMAQYGYSVAVPLEGINVGITLKLLQGIGYFGINPDSSFAYIKTNFDREKNFIEGDGKYYFQQSLGGRGFAIDIGISTKEIDGYRFGASLTNLFGRLTFNKSTLISRMFDEEKLLPWDGQFYEYNFYVDEARFDKFFEGAGFLEIFRGKGKTVSDSTNFTIRYPSLARFSMSKQFNRETLLATDFVAGFEDRFYSFGSWKWSIGVELTRFENRPLRFGISLGGRQHKGFSLGRGRQIGFIHIDWAIGMNQGLWFSTARGLSFSIAAHTTRKWKDKR